MKPRYYPARVFSIVLLTLYLSACSQHDKQQPVTGGSQSPSVSYASETSPVDQVAPTAAVVSDARFAASRAEKSSQFDFACLLGAWELTDLASAMANSYERSGSAMTLERVEGQARYQFSPDGTIQIAYDNLSTILTGVLDNRPVEVVQGLDGSATARFQVDTKRSEVIFYDFGGEGLLFSLDINGQRLAEGNLPAWRAFGTTLTGSEPSTPGALIETSRAAVECEKDALRLRAIEPFPGPQIDLSRPAQ